ncbi:hypothetical protein [Anaeromyxobacter diazotrophicus]|nr:hypothetical protein [Anaeromyxobacter diazotrophicus]
MTDLTRGEEGAVGRTFRVARWIGWFIAAVALFVAGIALTSGSVAVLGACIVLSAMAFKRFVSEGLVRGLSRTWMIAAGAVGYLLGWLLLRTYLVVR